eukprot:45511_1
MAMSKRMSDDIYSSILRPNDFGWNSALFNDPLHITTFICKQCNNVCHEAVELACDHDNKDESCYCAECLTQILKENNNTCPINPQHKNAIYHSSKTVRKCILKLLVNCPHSLQYKYKIKQNNEHIYIDTMNEEKEGNNVDGMKENICDWKGTLDNLITKHIKICKVGSSDIINRKIEIMEAFTEANINKLGAKIDSKYNETDNVTKSLQQQLKAKDIEIQKINQKLSEKDQEIESLKQGLNVQNNKIITMNKEINSINNIIDKLQQNHNDDNKECIEMNNDNFSVNGQKIFAYKQSTHQNKYIVTGATRIERKYVKQYVWVIETSESLQARFGIINDTNNETSKLETNQCIYGNSQCITAGTKECTFAANTSSFVQKNDMVTITLDYENNKVSFSSTKSGKNSEHKLKSDVNTVRFIAEICYVDATIKMVKSGKIK